MLDRTVQTLGAVRLSLAALIAVGVTIAGLTPAQAANQTFLVKDDLDGRLTKDVDDHTYPNRYRKGDMVEIVCQDSGPDAYGSRIWDLTIDNVWVPDTYIKTGSSGWAAGVPRCQPGAGPTGSDDPTPAPTTEPPATPGPTNRFLVKEDLDGRLTKDVDDHTYPDRYRKGDMVEIVCQDSGPDAYGSKIWDLTIDNVWVPDTYIKTGSSGWAAGVPRCPPGAGPEARPTPSTTTPPSHPTPTATPEGTPTATGAGEPVPGTSAPAAPTARDVAVERLKLEANTCSIDVDQFGQSVDEFRQSRVWQEVCPPGATIRPYRSSTGPGALCDAFLNLKAAQQLLSSAFKLKYGISDGMAKSLENLNYPGDVACAPPLGLDDEVQHELSDILTALEPPSVFGTRSADAVRLNAYAWPGLRSPILQSIEANTPHEVSCRIDRENQSWYQLRGAGYVPSSGFTVTQSVPECLAVREFYGPYAAQIPSCPLLYTFEAVDTRYYPLLTRCVSSAERDRSKAEREKEARQARVLDAQRAELVSALRARANNCADNLGLGAIRAFEKEFGEFPWSAVCPPESQIDRTAYVGIEEICIPWGTLSAIPPTLRGAAMKGPSLWLDVLCAPFLGLSDRRIPETVLAPGPFGFDLPPAADHGAT